MSGDLSSYEGQSGDGKEPSQEEGCGTSSFSRWLALTVILMFLLIYLPFPSNPWIWFIAIASSYTVAVFGIALHSAFDFSDADDLFGDSRVPRYAARLLLPHAVMMVPMMLGAYLWLHLEQALPHWVTVEGRKGSLWDLCGLLLVLVASIVEGTSLGSWIKRRLASVEN
ncbi:MAG: hypothetical protein ACLGSD_07470 [Acidobacteriota bacterium]